MILITLNGYHQQEIRSWQIGDNVDRFLEKTHLDAAIVIANGKELTLIQQNIGGIPVSYGASCKWQKPWAQFIFDNLVNFIGEKS